MSDTKTCNKCQRTLPLTEFYSQNTKNGGLRHRPECKECKRAIEVASHHRKKGNANPRKHKPYRRKGETLDEYRKRLIRESWERAVKKAANNGH